MPKNRAQNYKAPYKKLTVTLDRELFTWLQLHACAREFPITTAKACEIGLEKYAETLGFTREPTLMIGE